MEMVPIPDLVPVVLLHEQDAYIREAIREEGLTALTESISQFIQEIMAMSGQIQDNNGKDQLFDSLRLKVDQRFPRALENVEYLQREPIMKIMHGNFIRLLMCYMLVFNYEAEVDTNIIQLFESINELKIKKEYAKDYNKYYVKLRAKIAPYS